MEPLGYPLGESVEQSPLFFALKVGSQEKGLMTVFSAATSSSSETAKGAWCWGRWSTAPIDFTFYLVRELFCDSPFVGRLQVGGRQVHKISSWIRRTIWIFSLVKRQGMNWLVWGGLIGFPVRLVHTRLHDEGGRKTDKQSRGMTDISRKEVAFRPRLLTSTATDVPSIRPKAADSSAAHDTGHSSSPTCCVTIRKRKIWRNRGSMYEKSWNRTLDGAGVDLFINSRDHMMESNSLSSCCGR